LALAQRSSKLALAKKSSKKLKISQAKISQPKKAQNSFLKQIGSNFFIIKVQNFFLNQKG
jgi:hypothetical protein